MFLHFPNKAIIQYTEYVISFLDASLVNLFTQILLFVFTIMIQIILEILNNKTDYILKTKLVLTFII